MQRWKRHNIEACKQLQLKPKKEIHGQLNQFRDTGLYVILSTVYNSERK
jgi:hypothetical protein